LAAPSATVPGRMPPRHAAIAVLVAVGWGLNFVVIDVGLDAFPPLLFVAVRFVLVAFPAVLLVGRPRVGWRVVVGVGVFTSAGQFGLLFVAMDAGLPAGLASLVLQVQAVFTVALAVVALGERPGRLQLAGGGIAFAGIAVIALGRGGAVPLLAVLACVAAGGSWAIGNVITRRAEPPAPLALVVWSGLVPPVPLGLLSLATEGTDAWRAAWSGLDLPGLLALAYVVVVATFLGYGRWGWLMARHPASTVAPFTLLVPVVGIAAAWALLGERPGPLELAGAGVVLLGLACVTGLVGHRSAREAPVATELAAAR
jgi:O-acetylserine/cysteine efflux transporter